MNKLKFLILLNLNLVLCSNNSIPGYNDRYEMEIFENKTDENVYNKYVHPNYQMPIRVNTSIYLFSFGSIDDTRTEYSIQLLIRFHWIDERLIIKTDNNKILKLEGGQWHVNRIWTPSMHIPNNREPDALQNSGQNPVLTHIQSNGEVLISKRILLNGFSKMNFRLYPLDIQLCDIEIESNELSDSVMRLEWNDDQPFALADDFSWSGFELINYTLTHVKSMYSHTGTFSKLVATFTLRREFGHFILDIYIPSMMFVVSSWTSFWVEIPAAPARVTLGITTMLTLVTSAKTARDKLPRVSYIHALDIWILMCTFFVFASLVEYATVNFIYNKDKRSKKKRINNNNNNNNNNQNNGLRRTLSNSSFKSLSSDSNYSTMKSVKSEMFLKPPQSPLFHRRSNSGEINSSYIKDMNDGGIELIVPNFNADNISTISRSDSEAPVFCSLPLPSFKIAKEPQDIANEIDRKCRIIFPITFLLVNVIYWTTLALLSYY